MVNPGHKAIVEEGKLINWEWKRIDDPNTGEPLKDYLKYLLLV